MIVDGKKITELEEINASNLLLLESNKNLILSLKTEKFELQKRITELEERLKHLPR